MKKMNLFFYLALCLMIFSCVKDDEFNVPEISFEEPNITVNSSIASVKAMYGGYEPVLIGGGNSTEMYIEGYVVSSDESGNYYKQLIIQDKPQNPTAGISVSTEATNMYTFLEPGRKIYIRVDGLYTGLYSGLPSLGVLDGSEIGRMSVEEFQNRVFRSTVKDSLVPVVRTFSTLTANDLNTLVAFENVQISDADLGKTYANPTNNYAANRTFISCDYSESMVLRTSGYANFKSELIPEGSGTLTAIHAIFNSNYQLFIRDTKDVDCFNPRCQEPGQPQGILLFEDFEGLTNTGTGQIINLVGWTNLNVSGGNTRYEGREFDSNKYAQISAYNSGESTVIAWLITPAINLEKTVAPKLKFLTKDGFNNGEGLKVWVSSNFSGNPLAASWTELSAVISTGNTSGYPPVFAPSGEVDLSAFIGENIVIGFKYTGGSSGVTTTYQIDDVMVFDE